ncbi:MAG TPA: tRNA (adenosine(37)-N6)-threonylcarbamoyltransferase complex dimerization subunit type 1 TsaB [Gammaproteobacteria bacterium]|nr:tRNA (adenosine(37)-N6)-threonylcarbamoyltransferase complex dimerization subunit type 1 TsaB [Gammaproteobacteria bacterium]
MYKILAIETATEACSVALLHEGKILQRFEHRPQGQADLVLPMIDSLLTEARLKTSGLDAIAYGRGPGSFTGLRIAAAVTQGIAVATGLPVIPVSTLATVAQGVYREHGHTSVIAAIDARMQEIYWGCYRLKDGMMAPVGDEQVSPPREIAAPVADEIWAGACSGWRAYPEVLGSRLEKNIGAVYPEFWPQAMHLLELAQPLWEGRNVIEADTALPVYLRNNVAQPKAG